MQIEPITVNYTSRSSADVSWLGIEGWYTHVFIDGKRVYPEPILLEGTAKQVTVTAPVALAFAVEVHEAETVTEPVFAANSVNKRPTVTFTKSTVLPRFYAVYIDGKKAVVVAESGADIYTVQLRSDIGRGWHTCKVTAIDAYGAETDHDMFSFWEDGYIATVTAVDFDGSDNLITATLTY